MAGSQRHIEAFSRAEPHDANKKPDTSSLELTAVAAELNRRVVAAWPTLHVDLEPFVQLVLATCDGKAPLTESIASLHVEDMFLAYACSIGNAAALKEFERECVDELNAAAAKLRLTEGDRDELRQRLWQKLFLRSEGCPMRILDYRGSGRLRHWFRVVATRCILDDLRQSKRATDRPLRSGAASLSAQMTEVDPELASIRRQYQDVFRTAFAAAVLRLEPEERNILKCHYLMGMSTAELGQAFGTHKATMARHLVRTREKLLMGTRELLKSSLRADTDELNSVMRLFDDGLSVSLSRLLR